MVSILGLYLSLIYHYNIYIYHTFTHLERSGIFCEQVLFFTLHKTHFHNFIIQSRGTKGEQNKVHSDKKITGKASAVNTSSINKKLHKKVLSNKQHFTKFLSHELKNILIVRQYCVTIRSSIVIFVYFMPSSSGVVQIGLSGSTIRIW